MKPNSTADSALKTLLTAFAVILIAVGVAQAAGCSKKPTVSVSIQPTLPNYNPFTTTQTITSVITITNNGSGTCGFSLAFSPNTVPAYLASGSNKLGYTITDSNGPLEYLWTGSQPAVGVRHDYTGILPNKSVQDTVTVTVATGQFVPSGTYIDTYVTADIWDNGNVLGATSMTYDFSSRFNVSETVLAVCNLPTPTVTSMSFNPAIRLGVPNPAVTQTSTINTVQCTSPAGIQLSATTMEQTPVGTAPSGFDNFINWTATATYGTATATITTTGLTAVAPVQSAVTNGGTGATNTGTLNVTGVHLLAGKPLLAGTYSGVLTIQVDPSF